MWLQLYFVLTRVIFFGEILPRVPLSIHQFKNIWMTPFWSSPELASECYLSDVMYLIKIPRGFSFWPPAWQRNVPGGPAGHASFLTLASQELWVNKALWLLHPPGEPLSVCLSLSCSTMKQMIFCSWWLRNTRPLYAFLCDPQTIRQYLLSLLSVHLVHSWQRLSSDIFALLFFFYCLYRFCKRMFILFLNENWKNYLFALFGNFFCWWVVWWKIISNVQ